MLCVNHAKQVGMRTQLAGGPKEQN
jgi:hypothetical protein